MDDAVHERFGPAKLIVIVCGLVTSDPEVPKLSEERVRDIVEGPDAPDCVTGAFWPPMVKFPARVCEVEFAVTDQLAVITGTDTDAHGTFDDVAGAPQSLGVGVIARFPEDAAGPILMLDGLTA